jgi:hypothetical protein
MKNKKLIAILAATESGKVLLMLVVMCFGSVSLAQEAPTALPRFELFGGYSVNTDYVRSRQVILIVDQKASPFFSHGSGPKGFEVSFKRYVWRGLGIKGDLSFYSDTFAPSRATYCQPAGCVTGLTFEAIGRALYLTVGPEWKFRRDKTVAPFAQALAGVVHARSRFRMAGSGVGEPFMGGLILFNSAGFSADRNITYSDSNADTGLALSIGGGLDIQPGKRLGFRVAMDYDPTFLVRPVIHDPTVDGQGRIVISGTIPSERSRQDHVRLTMGIVWRIR